MLDSSKCCGSQVPHAHPTLNNQTWWLNSPKIQEPCIDPELELAANAAFSGTSMPQLNSGVFVQKCRNYIMTSLFVKYGQWYLYDFVCDIVSCLYTYRVFFEFNVHLDLFHETQVDTHGLGPWQQVSSHVTVKLGNQCFIKFHHRSSVSIAHTLSQNHKTPVAIFGMHDNYCT